MFNLRRKTTSTLHSDNTSVIVHRPNKENHNKLQMRVEKSSYYQKMNRSICELYEKWTTSGSGITARQECIEKYSRFDSLINLCFKSGRIKRTIPTQWRCIGEKTMAMRGPCKRLVSHRQISGAVFFSANWEHGRKR